MSDQTILIGPKYNICALRQKCPFRQTDWAKIIYTLRQKCPFRPYRPDKNYIHVTTKMPVRTIPIGPKYNICTLMQKRPFKPNQPTQNCRVCTLLKMIDHIKPTGPKL